MRFRMMGLTGSLVASLVLSSLPAHSQSRFRLTEIEPLPLHRNSGAWSINNSGAVVAVSSPTADLDTPDAKPMIWSAGTAKLLPGRAGGYVSAGRINNKNVVLGSFSQPEQEIQAAYWRNFQGPNLLPHQPNMGQYYTLGLNDLGLITGFAAFNSAENQGFLFDIATNRLTLNPTYVYGDTNTAGDMIRSLAHQHDGEVNPVEVSTARGVFPLPNPAGLAQPNNVMDIAVSSSGRLTAFLSDDDPSDGCTGCGGSCVRWDPPSYTPVVFNPEGFGSRDYCAPSRANGRGDTLVMHQSQVKEDEYVNIPMVVINNRYSKLLSLCPELARYDSFYMYDINDKLEMVGTGYRNGIVRGIHLKPIL